MIFSKHPLLEPPLFNFEIFFQFNVLKFTLWKINMEPKNGGLEDDFPISNQGVTFNFIPKKWIPVALQCEKGLGLDGWRLFFFIYWS